MAELNLSNLLPREFHDKHGVLLYYNDLITDILIKADTYQLSTVQVKFDKNINISIDEDNDGIDWLFANGFENEAYRVLSIHTFFSLVRDFIFYMHESFSCSERGKVTVAYSISRKPFKDTLFYLCWLLTDSHEMIDCIINKEPTMYDISYMDSQKKKKILLNSASDIEYPFDASSIYDLIYDRKSENGLSRIWDQASHLVTNNKNYPTKKGNLNFVFSDSEMWQDYWSYYYDKMPLIMQFSTEIIIKIYENIIKPSESIVILNKLIRDSKFYNSLKLVNHRDDLKLLRNLLEGTRYNCDECEKEFKLEGEVLEEFIIDYTFTCPKCKMLNRVGNYIFDYEKMCL